MKSSSLWAALETLTIAHLVLVCHADGAKNDARFSELRVLLEESPDGTILVTADRKGPNVRIPVQSLIDCNVTYSEAGFKAGAVISVNRLCFRRIPINLPTILAPSYRYNTSRVAVDETLDSRRSSTISTLSPLASEDGEKSDLSSNFSNRRTNTASSLSGKCLSSILTPELLNLSYVGKESLKIGDKVTWVYSIRQGTIPLAWIMLALSVKINAQVPYYYSIPPSTVSHNFSVPWNFDSQNTVMSGSFTVKITADLMPGVYTLNQVSLTTQACPVTLSSTFSLGGWISY